MTIVATSPPPSSSSSWTCHTCTFINSNSNGLACTICQTARNGKFSVNDYSFNNNKKNKKKFCSTLDLPLPPPVPKKNKKKNIHSVKFGSIQVREYERLIDATTCVVGLSLGWNYLEYDATFNNKSATSNSMKKEDAAISTKMQSKTLNQRCKILLRYGYTHPQLQKATALYNSQLSRRQPAASAICVSNTNGTTTLLPPSKRSTKSKIEKMMFRFF